MRYFNWIAGVLQGDFGTSYASAGVGYRRVVADISGAALAEHAVPRQHDGADRGAAVAVGLGLLAALYRNSFFDRAVNVDHPDLHLVPGILHRLYPIVCCPRR